MGDERPTTDDHQRRGPRQGASHSQPDERIASLVNEYFDRRQAGEELTPDRFAAEHPGLAETLQPYLEGLALLDEIRTATAGVGGPVRVAAAAGALPVIEGYELIEEIGRGGMGVVYKALQVTTKRIVALKVMLAGPFASPTARRRFEREVELAARLRHPSIVTVLESGQVSSGQQYFAMDYVEGVHLDTYVSRCRPEVRTTLELFLRVCQAVEYAHRHGVVHRDLKPANVLVDADGDPHTLDFGLAKGTDQADYEDSLAKPASTPGQVMGTLRYLSPEQAAGMVDQIDARTDVYALGVMVFEALTGSLPYDTNGRPAEVVRRILEAPPTAPSSLSEHIDGELETIILRALEKERHRRYQSVGQLGEDLRRYLNGEAILAKRSSRLYVLRKKLAKQRGRIALAAAALALGLVGVWGGMWWSQRSLAEQRRAEWIEARHQVLRIMRELDVNNVQLVRRDAHFAFIQYPTLTEAKLVSAQVRWQQGYLSRAIRFLEEELRRDPRQWAYCLLLARIYRDRVGDRDLEREKQHELKRAARADREREKRDDLEGEAEDELEPDEAASLEPDDEADLERADELEVKFEQEFPGTAEAWYVRSFAALNRKEPLRCVREAVERDPKHALAWERLTDLAQQTGDLATALNAVEQLIRLAPESREWKLLRTYLRNEQGELSQDEPTTGTGVPRDPASLPGENDSGQPARTAPPEEPGKSGKSQ